MIYPASILYKSIAGRYRPVRVADGPITACYRFIKKANWVYMGIPRKRHNHGRQHYKAKSRGRMTRNDIAHKPESKSHFHLDYRGPVCFFLVAWLQVAIEPFALFHHGVYD